MKSGKMIVCDNCKHYSIAIFAGLCEMAKELNFSENHINNTVLSSSTSYHLHPIKNSEIENKKIKT